MARYYDEVNERWISNDDQENQDHNLINDLRARGYVPELGLTPGSTRFSSIGGNNFANDLDYYTWLYGPGVTQESVNGETFYKTPNGADAYLPGTAPGNFAAIDPNFSLIPKLALGSIIGLGAMNGAFGSLGGLGGEAGAAAGTAGADLGASAATATELGTSLANAGNWAALDVLAGVPAGATYGAEAVAGGGLSDFLGGLFGSAKGTVSPVNSALNYFLNQKSARDLQNAAGQSAGMSNTLNDPRRQPYQAMLMELMSNPSSFYSTNPAVKAQLDLARQQFEANSAKMGTGGTQFNDYLKNVQNIASGTFNDQVGQLTTLSGFGFPSTNNSATYMQGQMEANKQRNEAYRFIPDLVKSAIDSDTFKGISNNIFSLG